jgi:hypothetical protein
MLLHQCSAARPCGVGLGSEWQGAKLDMWAELGHRQGTCEMRERVTASYVQHVQKKETLTRGLV